MKKFIRCFALFLTVYFPCSLLAAEEMMIEHHLNKHQIQGKGNNLLVQGKKTNKSLALISPGSFSAPTFNLFGDARLVNIEKFTNGVLLDSSNAAVSVSFNLPGKPSGVKKIQELQTQLSVVVPAGFPGGHLEVVLESPLSLAPTFKKTIRISENLSEDPELRSIPVTVPHKFLKKTETLATLSVRQIAVLTHTTPLLADSPVTHQPNEYQALILILIAVVVVVVLYADATFFLYEIQNPQDRLE